MESQDRRIKNPFEAEVALKGRKKERNSLGSDHVELIASLTHKRSFISKWLTHRPVDRICLDITRGLWLIPFHAYASCEHCKFSDKFISFSR